MRFQWQVLPSSDPAESKVQLRAHRSLELNRTIQFAFDAEADPADPRARLALASADLALEHHRAVVKLFRRGEPAAAAAMLRVLLDSGFAATYLLHRPTPDEASAMLENPGFYEEGRAYLPLTTDMMKELVKLPVIGPIIRVIHKDQLKAFHKLTHGDVPQLVRRRRSQPSFSAEERHSLVELADLFMLATAYVGAQALQSDVLKSSIIAIRNAVLVEALTRKGLPIDSARYDEVPPEPSWIHVQRSSPV